MLALIKRRCRISACQIMTCGVGLWLFTAPRSFGAESKPALGPWLMDLQLGNPGFKDPSELIPEERAELAQAPPEVKELIEKLQKHFKAVKELKQFGTNAVPSLLDILRTSKDVKMKEQALIAIDHLQPPPEMVLSALAEYLNTGEEAENAALVLARQGPEALLPLLSARTNRNSTVRAAVAWHVSDFRPDDKGNLRIAVNGDERIWPKFKPATKLISAALLDLLDDENASVRFRAAVGLGDIGGDLGKVIPALMRHLNDADATVRSDAVSALAHFGEAARPAAQLLAEKIYDPDRNVRSAAATALDSLGEHPDRAPTITIGSDKLQFIPTAGCFFREQLDNVVVSGNGHLTTRQEFEVPVVIRVSAKTDSTNIRLYFGRGVVIFNWEKNPRELRIHDPRTGKPTPVPGAGFVEANVWHDIEWTVRPDAMEVSVDGKKRATITGEYAGIVAPVGFGGAQGSTVVVKQVSIR